jgi:uncharacterized protein YbaA (DUF1428 family)
MTHFIVQVRTAKMPTSVKAPYRRVAVLEVQDGIDNVSMISSRARGVVRIVETWERCHARGKNTAFTRALAAAQELAAQLNSEVA